MAEVEIIIDRSGSSKATITTEQGEDPACLVYDRIIQGVAAQGLAVSEAKLEERTHGHAHQFEQHHH